MNGPVINFIGNLTRDPELKYTPNTGAPYIQVSVAVNNWRGPDREPDTHFFNCTFWRYQAESIANHCTKGSQVYVSGRYNRRKYTRQDGSEGFSHDVAVRDLFRCRTSAREEEDPEKPEELSYEDPADQDDQEDILYDDDDDNEDDTD